MLDGSLASAGTGWLDPTNGMTVTTPADVQRRQLLAQQLIQEGGSTAPIQSAWQGAARLAQALSGGLQMRQARQDQTNGQANNQAMLAKLLGQDTGDMSIPATPGFTSPALASADATQDAAQDGSPSPQMLAAGLANPSGGGSSLPSFAASPGGLTPNAKTALDYFQSKGLPPVAAAGLVGGFQNESGPGLNTGALAKGDGSDGSNSIGIGQWNGARAAALKSYAASQGMDPGALETQLGFTMQELSGPERSTMARLLAAKDPQSATAAALGYERPAGWTPQNPMGAVTAGKRLAATNALAGGLGPMASGGASPGAPPQLSAYMGPNATISSSGLAAYEAARGGAGGTQVASLNPNFAPSSGATMPAANPANPAPAAGQPYGSVPVNIGGRMMTRQQAEDSQGLDLDGTDYDAAAQKLGMTPPPSAASGGTDGSGAGAAPGAITRTVPALPSSGPSPASSVVQGAEAAAPNPTQYGLTPGRTTIAMRGRLTPQSDGSGFTPVAGLGQPAARSGGLNKAALLGYISDPYTTPQMAQIASSLLSQSDKTDAWQTVKDGDGSIWQRNAVTGEMKVVQDNSKPDHYGIVKNEDGTAFAYDKSDPTKIIPMGGGGVAYRPATPEEKKATGAAFIGPGGKPVFAPASTTVNVGGAEKASEAAYGKAEGDEFGAILKAGQSARATQGQIALMNDAFAQGGGQISTGPFAKSILGAKQAILNTTGIDLGGIPETEAVQKLGFGLATNLTKEISQRPAQQEFLKALENVPGIFMSPQGSKVMMSVLNQQAQAKVDLARLVANPENRKNWPDVEQAYYDAHPLISPFTHKPLSAADVGSLATQAQQAGVDPATGQAAGVAPRPAAASQQAPVNGGAMLDQARDAIAKGAPRDAVIQRLRQNNIDPAGL